MADGDDALDLRDRATLRPLRVLLTRPDEQAAETAELVRAAGGEPLLFPCLHRAPPPDMARFLQSLAALPGCGVVALSSANAVAALSAGLQALGRTTQESLSAVLVAAVGPRTAAALLAEGVSAQVVASEESTAEGLATAILAALRERGQARARVFFPRAAETSGVLADTLRKAEVEVVEAIAYEMAAAAPARLAPMVALLKSGQVDLAPFGSPRTARIALSVLGDSARALFEPVQVGALGPSTAAALREAGLRVDAVAQPATFLALLGALASCRRSVKICSPVDPGSLARS